MRGSWSWTLNRDWTGTLPGTDHVFDVDVQDPSNTACRLLILAEHILLNWTRVEDVTKLVAKSRAGADGCAAPVGGRRANLRRSE